VRSGVSAYAREKSLVAGINLMIQFAFGAEGSKEKSDGSLTDSLLIDANAVNNLVTCLRAAAAAAPRRIMPPAFRPRTTKQPPSLILFGTPRS
jgi:hypothetical protein